MINYIYAAVWYGLGLLLIFSFRKEHPVVPWLGVYFLFAGAWWTVRAVTGTDVFSGTMGWIFRGVTAVALITAGAVMYNERKRAASSSKKQ